MHPSALSQEDDQAGQALQQEIEEILAPGHWPYHELDQVLIHQPQVPYEELDELME
uniref:Uncharacterized protein n=1 Tax=Setaria digitata TaxID=48799 RepID=A0A915PIK1_9BILA